MLFYRLFHFPHSNRSYPQTCTLPDISHYLKKYTSYYFKNADTGSILQDGFGGFSLRMTRIKGESAFIGGIRGGWIMNHSYVVSAGIYGLMNEIDAPDEVSTGDKVQKIRFGYFGFEPEYIGKWDKRIHYSIHSIIGIGYLSYAYKDVVHDDYIGDLGSSTAFGFGHFIFEPSFNIEVNVSDKTRINTGVSYRSVAGVDLQGLDNSDISGFGLSISVKFGGYE